MDNHFLELYDLRCNHQQKPTAIDDLPVFSWKVRSGFPGDAQTGYRLIVKAGNAMVWDSGVVDSSDHCVVPDEGLALCAKTQYQWTVAIRNRSGVWAEADSQFETGKYGQPWAGRWISAPWCKLDRDDQAAVYLRKTISIEQPAACARLYICGLGLYEAWMDGKRISDIELEPAYTKYDAEVLYRVFDVTEQLQQAGPHTLGVILGNGWYNCFTKDAWNAPQSTWRGIPRLLCELTVSHADGAVTQIVSDTSWKTSRGPIVFNANRSGEHYDARLERPLWCCPALDDRDWQPAIQVRSPGGWIKAAQGYPIRVVERFTPKQSWQTEEGHRIFDFGQNLAGRARLTVWGPAGSEYILRYAEELTSDGQHVDQSHLRCFIREGEFQTDRYISDGNGKKRWASRFVYHGFRYVELETVGATPSSAELDAEVLHTDYPLSGQFDCSDPDLNMIQQMALWSTRSNSMGLPTSDPHREKNAWTGDNGFASEQMLLNYDSLLMQSQWLDSVCDCQRIDGAIPCVCPSTGWGFNWGNGPDWSLVLTQMPWRFYCSTGDRRFLEKAFPYVEKHFRFMESMANDEILDYGIGDWCAPFEGPAVSVNMESFKAPRALTDTLCYYEAAVLLGKMCETLGRENPYKEKQQRIRQALLKHFVTLDLEVKGDCQTSDAGVVWNHLLDAADEKVIADRLVKRISENGNHLDFGVLGQRYVMEVLGESGHVEKLFLMLKNPTYPGYLHLARNGCTTLTECWNLGGSHNHMMFSHVSAILYKYIAGLKADEEAGSGALLVRPSLMTDRMDCWEETRYGRFSVQWEKREDGAEITVEVPFGCHARLIPPNTARAEEEVLTCGIHRRHWKLL